MTASVHPSMLPVQATRFYYASSYNLPGEPGGGARVARNVIPMLETITRHKCTSRWPYSPWHRGQIVNDGGRSVIDHRKIISTTDIVDLCTADYMIAIPVTPSARGCHVEIGMALALDKPVYLLRARYTDPVGFDHACLDLPQAWIDEIWYVVMDKQKSPECPICSLVVDLDYTLKGYGVLGANPEQPVRKWRDKNGLVRDDEVPDSKETWFHRKCYEGVLDYVVSKQ